jgi:hypothetical protein
MIRDNNLELSTQWQVKTGADIGGPVPFVPPTSFVIIPPLTTSMAVYIAGPAYTDGMAALQRPWMPVFNPAAIPITLQYEICTDLNAPSQAQAIETDLRICDTAGWNYNGSFQINYEEGGQLQVYNPTTPWLNTGCIPGKYSPGLWYPVAINYLVNTVTHVLTFVSASIDGIVYWLGQTAPAQQLNWVPGLYNQFQLDLAASGGAFSIGLKNIDDVWG